MDTLPNAAWRKEMLQRAQRPDAKITPLFPANTKLPRTVYASEERTLPAVIIDSREGRQYAPDDEARVLAFGELVGDEDFDTWLTTHGEFLRKYSADRSDITSLYRYFGWE